MKPYLNYMLSIFKVWLIFFFKFDKRKIYSRTSVLASRFLTCALFLNVFAVQAQAPSKLWDKTFGGNESDEPTAVIQTSDGGYLLAGSSSTGISGDKTQASKGSLDYWIIKISSSGSKQWDKTFGGSEEDILTAAIQTGDGGYLLAGRSASGTGGDKTQASKGSLDYWIIKISSSGSKQWDKTFGGSNTEELVSIIPTMDGGYLLAGSSDSGISGDKSQANIESLDYWIVKISSSGSKQWDKTFGGFEYDILTSTIQTTDGGYLLAGYTPSYIGGDKSETSKGAYDYWIIKVNSSGGKQWDKTIGGSNYDYLSAAIQTSDGGYLLAGYSDSEAGKDKTQASRGDFDYWVVKISSSGSKQWDKTFGGDSYDQLSSTIQTTDGGYLLAGSSYSYISGDKTETNRGDRNDYWVVKMSSSGSKQWDKTLGGESADELTAAIQTSDGGYLLAGWSASGTGGDKTQAGSLNGDYWIVKTTQEGPKSTEYVMINSNKTTCSGTFYDSGFMGMYANNSSIIQTFTPATTGSKLQFKFTSFSLENNYDYLYIYNGASTSSPLIGTYTGTTSPGTITATNPTGQLTFRFTSDYSETFPGWTATVSCITFPVNALWNKRFGGSSYEGLTSLLQTTDGGYLLGGYSGSGISGDRSEANRGIEDYWVVKVSSSGVKQWDKRFGGSAIDGLASAIQTTDGGYLLGGTSQSGAGGDKSENSRGLKDYWIVKITSSGVKQWDKRFGGTGDDVLKAMLQTTDGGYLLAGRTKSGAGGDKSEASRGLEDYWVVKITSSGAKQWDKRFGGSGDDYLTAVASSIDGGYLLGGYSTSGSGGDKTQPSRGGVDYWIVKISSGGVKQSDIRFGGSSHDYLTSLIRTSDGGYLLGGASHSEAAGGDKSQPNVLHTDYWIVKLSTNGIKQWDKCFGGYQDDELASVIQTSDGGYLLGGTSNSVVGGHKSEQYFFSDDYWIVKISNSGVKQWDKTFGGSSEEELTSVMQTSDGGYLLGGFSHSGIGGDKSEASRGSSDYWIVKTTQEGPKSSDYVMSNSSKTTCSGIFYDPGFMGMYANNQTITQTFSPATSGAKLRFSFTSFNLEAGYDFLYIYNGASTSAPLIGKYSGTISPGTITATNTTGQLTFRFTSNASTNKPGWTADIACISTSLTQIAQVDTVAKSARIDNDQSDQQNQLSELTAYPNPFSDKVTLGFTLQQPQQVSVEIYDNRGMRVATLYQAEAEANKSYQVEWIANENKTGIYIIKVSTPSNVTHKKVILTR